MILYKYMTYEVALSVLFNNTLAFTCAEDFNDPFELTYLGFDDHEQVSAQTLISAYRNTLSRKYGILSLTRNPLNKLMWAHYADSHQGIVIGLDVDLAGFNDNASNLIPAKYGDVTYTSHKKKPGSHVADTDELENIGSDYLFNFETFHLYKRAFLQKSIDWSYEEEVRVVKALKNLGSHYEVVGNKNNVSGSWSRVPIPALNRSLYCFHLPKNSIKEVYIGAKTSRGHVRLRKESKGILNIRDLKSMCISKNIEIFQTRIDTLSWDLVGIKET